MASLLRRFCWPPLLAIAIAGLAGGCGDFQDVTTVVDLRVLAISAQPSEILVDPTTVAMGGQTFATTLTALIADPAGGDRPITVDALACPRTIDAVTAATGKNGVVCQPFDPQSTAADASVAVTPPPPASPLAARTPFGDAQLDLPFAFPDDLLVRGYQLDPYAALGFQMPITFQLTVAAGAESEVAIKRVIFTVPPPGHSDQSPNANPVITGISGYFIHDSDANPVDPQPFDLSQPALLALGASLWLEPQGADSQAEVYFTRALSQEANPQVVITQVTETLRYSFYASAGRFSLPVTNTVPPVLRQQPQRIHLESQYQAPTTMPADPNVTFWIVVRDERGGASWIKGRFLLIPAAP